MKLITLAVAAAALGSFAVPAQAASPIQIGRTQYDSPGSDTRTASSLNAEYVTIKNVTATARSLRGWTLRDAANHVYTFGAVTLGGGKSLLLHTGRGTNSATNLYWGSGNYIWNNDGDTATLKTATGSTTDTCRWDASGTGVTAC